MTIGLQVSSSIPTTLHDWERTLTWALLRADDGDSDAIRSFEITPETLAHYCGLGSEYSNAAEAAFKHALRTDPHLTWCLQHGTYKMHGPEQPNCLAMLALSLLVDSLLDGVYEDKGQYRAKLSEWLNIDRSFMDLRGIATMWRELVAWLDGRIASGAPFRKLILPEIPVTWTHIGYTRYLSFPTKRDLRLLTKQIGRAPTAGFDPATLVLRLDPVVRTSSASHGMKVAFEDFKKALRSGAASVDHRFWRLVMRAREQCGHNAPVVSATLIMEFDEDGDRRYRVGGTTDDGSELLGNVVASPPVADSLNLGPSIRRGILFFRSSGLASWTATGEPPPGNGPFHIAIANRHARLAGGSVIDFVGSGNWLVSVEPVPARTIIDVLRRIGIGDAKHTIRTIGLIDGIRVGSAWLGQPRYLPYLEGASGIVDVNALDGGTPGRLVWSNGDLRADAPVDGLFALADVSSHWSRRASFVSLAEVHPATDAASYAIPAQSEWKLTNSQPCARAAAPSLAWDGTPNPNQDVFEALYASSRSGTGEGDAVAIIGRVHGRRSWEILRALQEASFFDARMRERWKGRVFTLRRPTLTPVQIGPIVGVVVSGAVPVRLEADFRGAVELQGGSAYRRCTAESLVPPLLAAINIEARRLADALGWTVINAPAQPDGSVGSRLLETKVRGHGYQASSAWDWTLGRFRVGPATPGRVTLTRFVHPGGRDHDLYRVVGRTERCFHSRYAAILDAHAQAGLPLFRYENGEIVRLTSEGALPLEIAAALRLRTLSNGGATVGGWSYVAGRKDLDWLTDILPGIIDGVSLGPVNDPAMSFRRGRGSRRPLWNNGIIGA
ncbi:hypothetical protein ACSBOB_26795 [Mesorhizobium sp. ASY16-5R]|uniref:hypothetical protein n=1 Tax=Mesorhizobium sp. ASY16-5R TaxID=3445772 RepID=UPI003F9F18DF